MVRKKLKVAIVIVNYNSTNETLVLLRFLVKLSFPKLVFSIILVDNGSANKEYTRLLQFSKRNKTISIKIIRNEKNVGLSKALNQTLPFCQKSDYIWRLDSDALPTKQTLPELLSTMQGFSDCGVVGSPAYEKNHSQKPLGGGYTINWWTGHLSLMPLSETPFTCDIAFGYNLLFSTKLIKAIGYLSDENFFAYTEDMDICCQISQLGKRVYVNQKAAVFHPSILDRQYSAFSLYLSIRNQIYLVRKHASVLRMAFFTLYCLSVLFLVKLYLIFSWPISWQQKVALFFAVLRAIEEGFSPLQPANSLVTS